jgi:hypothetical protein
MPLFRRTAPARRRILPVLLLVILSALFSSRPVSLRSSTSRHAGQEDTGPARSTSTLTTRTPEQKAEARESYMGMYMGARKMGHTHVRQTPTMYRGKPALKTLSRSVLNLIVLGSATEQNLVQDTISDLDYRPLVQTFDIESRGSKLHIEAEYDYADRKIVCRIGEGAKAATKTLTIPPGADLAGDSGFLTAGLKLSVGQKLTRYYLEPLTVQLHRAQIEVTGRETVRDLVSGKDVSAFVVVADMPQGKMRSYETEEGEMLRGTMNLGSIELTMALEPKARALDPDATAPPMPGGEEGKAAYTPPADFAVATAITIEKPIPDPRRLRTLTVIIGGIPEDKTLISDERQKATLLPVANPLAGNTARFAVRVPESEKTAKLPITDDVLNPYLKAAALLEVDDPAIQKTAKELRGSETNAYRVASAIRGWVSKNMTADASIGVPRSAKDVFQRRRGVCRDYATLYAAIARAAGIPTRLCGGIVYADGKFFYHAWAESYVGSWVAFDPTLHDIKNPVDFVDATHIKFSQGDVTDMFDVATVIGKLRISVEE